MERVHEAVLHETGLRIVSDIHIPFGQVEPLDDFGIPEAFRTRCLMARQYSADACRQVRFGCVRRLSSIAAVTRSASSRRQPQMPSGALRMSAPFA